MKRIELNDKELEELKLIIEYALEKDYGVVYEDIDITLSIIDKLFSISSIKRIKENYIFY